MKDFWEKYIKAKSEKASVKVNEAFNNGCNEVKARVRTATAKHKGYEEFDLPYEPFYLPENVSFNSSQNTYDESDGQNEEFKNYPTIKTEKSFLRIQKSLSILNPKNAITSITSTLKRKQ